MPNRADAGFTIFSPGRAAIFVLQGSTFRVEVCGLHNYEIQNQEMSELVSAIQDTRHRVSQNPRLVAGFLLGDISAEAHDSQRVSYSNPRDGNTHIQRYNPISRRLGAELDQLVIGYLRLALEYRLRFLRH